MENNNNDNENLGCIAAVFVMIIGIVMFVCGQNWGFFVLLSGIAVAVVCKAVADQSKTEREKQRKYEERHSQRASRLFELREKRANGSGGLLTVTTEENPDYQYIIKGIYSKIIRWRKIFLLWQG